LIPNVLGIVPPPPQLLLLLLLFPTLSLRLNGQGPFVTELQLPFLDLSFVPFLSSGVGSGGMVLLLLQELGLLLDELHVLILQRFHAVVQGVDLGLKLPPRLVSLGPHRVQFGLQRRFVLDESGLMQQLLSLFGPNGSIHLGIAILWFFFFGW